MRTMMVSVRIL